MLVLISNKPAARHYAALLVACLALAACDSTRSGFSPDPPAQQIIPAPASLQLHDGAFEVADGVQVSVSSSHAAAVDVARYFLDLVARTRGLHLELASGATPERNRIRLAIAPSAAPSDAEAYRLTVSSHGVDIVAADPRGLFYGAVSLWQLITARPDPGGPARLPALEIDDRPRFAWRGLMLDSARHYQPVEFIKKLIDWMALHKLNVLHWHLTDDQGWRLEIRRYPLLTEIGAWRVPAGAVWPREPDPATGRPRRYGGYYTQDEVRDVVRYAAARHVAIVPEIEMPGHAQAAIAAYPRLGTGGAPPDVSPDWGVHDYLFNIDEETFTFIENVLSEVIDLFPAEYIHVGGDEAVKNRWIASPRVQARMRELGIANETALQGWFVTRIERFLNGHGRRLIGWDEILEGGVPARATVMSWRGVEGAVAAAQAGHDVVMAPAPTLYLDYLQSDSSHEPPGRPSFITLADVYAYEPVPAALAQQQAHHVLGAQLNAWTEHMRVPERIEHQAFPRIAALAEVTWSSSARRDWAGFLDRLPVQFARYRSLGIDYADTAFEPRARLTTGSAPGSFRVEFANQARFGEIRYTLDGSEPGSDSALYRAPLELAKGTELRAGTFVRGQRISAAVPVTVGARQLRRRAHEGLKQCTGNLVLRLEDDAPLEGERAVYNVDIVDPCWIYAAADLSKGPVLRAAVGQLPFNFQIGADADAIRRGDARTSEGELEVRIGNCEGDPVALLPLAPAATNQGVTELPSVRLPAHGVPHDLCLRFARPAIDPIWAIQWVELAD
jgi:hexosaminidase